MGVCMHVCMYVCMHVCMCNYVCVQPVASKRAIYDKFGEEGLKRGIPNEEGGTADYIIVSSDPHSYEKGSVHEVIN